MPSDVPTDKEFTCNHCGEWATVLRREGKTAIYQPLCKTHAAKLDKSAAKE